MTLKEIREKADGLGIVHTNKDTIAQIEKKIVQFEATKDLKKGIVSKDQIEAWKLSHGWIQRIEVQISETDIAVGYLKKPKRDHKAIAVTLYNQDKILECGEFLLQNCWLGGDTRLKDDDDVSDSAAIQANSIVNFLKGSSERV